MPPHFSRVFFRPLICDRWLWLIHFKISGRVEPCVILLLLLLILLLLVSIIEQMSDFEDWCDDSSDDELQTTDGR